MSSDMGQIEMQMRTSPIDVTSIHVTVTAIDFSTDVSTDLVEDNGSWSGTLMNVPPGTHRTVTAYAYDEALHLIYKGATENVTVYGGTLTPVLITLLPYPSDPGGPGLNTPPHFVQLTHPDAIATDETAELMAMALDPDDNALLTYTWSSTPIGLFDDSDVDGGGVRNVVVNRVSGDPVSILYTPPEDFTGFVIIQVSVSDGQATETTTFPIAVGAGIAPDIQFDVLPELSITGVDWQVLMPNGSTEIHYTLHNPGTEWSANPMHLRTVWTDTCGGRFETSDSEFLDIPWYGTVSRSVTYIASEVSPVGVSSCSIRLTVEDAFGASIWSGLMVWVEEPLTVFVTSANVQGGTFAGQSAAADAFCEDQVATSALPRGAYKALLSFDAISARDRIVDGPYTLPYNRGHVARNKAELFSGALLNSIRFDENSQLVGGIAFTGSYADGSPAERCNNWNTSELGVFARIGAVGGSADSWVDFGMSACDLPAHVYCFQQTHQRE